MKDNKPVPLKKIPLEAEKIVSVFGNSIVDKDSIVIRILPKLRKAFPKLEFVIEDPTETLSPPEDDWWIIDATKGVKKVMLINDLDHIDPSSSVSVHDYDLSFDLYLLQKLGKLPNMKIIVVPYDYSEKQAFKGVSNILKVNGF